MGVDAMRMSVVDVEEHELVWIVSWTTEEFVRTRNPELMLAFWRPGPQPARP
ncbi:YrhB domain-containing protein [Streptomyces sp. NPDC006332]|uniref:YrhB domain-containing protein n=1 Tax=Streptomyces sp. NPDC006332 TaxID=3155456 RepID=UPI00339FEE42